MLLTRPRFPPVFYRCYWSSPNPVGFETVEFEWSATSEYIEWYINKIGNTSANSVYQIIIAGGGTITPVGILVPLLKVTNHSPSLF
jgi:hypothetical protein